MNLYLKKCPILIFLSFSIIYTFLQPKHGLIAKKYMNNSEQYNAIEKLGQVFKVHQYDKETLYFFSKEYRIQMEAKKKHEVFDNLLQSSPIIAEGIKPVRIYHSKSNFDLNNNKFQNKISSTINKRRYKITNPSTPIVIHTVIKYSGPDEYSNYSKIINSEIKENLSLLSYIVMVERSDLKKIIKEIKLSKTGFTDKKIELGESLKSDFIIFLSIQINFLEKSVGISKYNFTFEGKFINIKTTEVKTAYESGNFDSADNENTSPLNLAVTNFGYKICDLVLMEANLKEEDFHQYIEKEELKLKKIKSKGNRNSFGWFSASIGSFLLGYELNKSEDKTQTWTAYGLYLIGTALFCTAFESFSNISDIAVEIKNRIKKHKKIYFQKFGHKYKP